MKILVLNAGSFSLKYKLFEDSYEKYGSKVDGDPRIAFKKLYDSSPELFLGLSAIGHRVVNGGSDFSGPTLMTSTNIRKLEKYDSIAPLHNPASISVIKDCIKQRLQPNYACFDTSFHQTIAEEAKIIPLPEELIKKHGLRRFGFHGLSHQYIAEKNPDTKRLISVHLGQGCSICAIKNGKSIDISMGFSPLEGVPMVNRSGNIDPALVLYLQKEASLNPDRLNQLLNNESGIAAVAGVDGDFRKILFAAGYKVEDPHFGSYDLNFTDKQKKSAKLAISFFVYQIAKTIGGYITALGGIDKIVFTGEIGAGSSVIREKIMAYFDYLDKIKFEGMYTNEELMIAQGVKKCLR